MPLAGEQITPTASTFAGSPLESPELAAAGLRTRLVQGFATGCVPGVITLAPVKRDARRPVFNMSPSYKRPSEDYFIEALPREASCPEAADSAAADFTTCEVAFVVHRWSSRASGPNTPTEPTTLPV